MDDTVQFVSEVGLGTFGFQSAFANSPFLLLDELDKAVGQGRSYPIGPALPRLLEPKTAERFRAENLDIEIDVRPVTITFTANRLYKLTPELLSRLQCSTFGCRRRRKCRRLSGRSMPASGRTSLA